jgi:hypothetical protein
LETLLTAVESESQFIDIARVSGFMQKVCLPLSIDNSVFLKAGHHSGSQWCDIVMVEGRTPYTTVTFVFSSPMDVQSVLVSLSYILSRTQGLHTTPHCTLRPPAHRLSLLVFYSYRFSIFAGNVPFEAFGIFAARVDDLTSVVSTN